MNDCNLGARTSLTPSLQPPILPPEFRNKGEDDEDCTSAGDIVVGKADGAKTVVQDVEVTAATQVLLLKGILCSSLTDAEIMLPFS